VRKNIPEFIPLRLQPDQVVGSVFLQCNGKFIDISSTHGIFCNEPFIIGIYVTENLPDLTNAKLIIHSAGKKRCTVSIDLKEKFNIEDQTVYLFVASKVSCNLAQQLTLRYLHFRTGAKQPFHLFNLYAALYCFPRKIIITSFKSVDYINLFPMDFQGYIQQKEAVLLGLRNTNITLEKILEQKQFVLIDFDHNSISPIYELGKHHSSLPPHREELPFKINNSDQLKCPIPEFATSYKELSLFNAINLGSHTLLIAKVIHQTFSNNDSHLYHISQFENVCNSHYKQFVIK
jgi:flavin reductase (DIM6/NTAB) family NADH-FMN oxidoreductase RutF